MLKASFTPACVILLIMSLEALSGPTEDPTLGTQESSLGLIKVANQESIEDINRKMEDFEQTFFGYEKRIKIFIDNMRRGYLSLRSDSAAFLEELASYMEQLPASNTSTKLVVNEKYRSKCYCEDQWWTPCPDRCADSCYYCSNNRCWGTFNNCSNLFKESSYYRPSHCKCYDGSSVSCDDGQMSNCYEPKTEVIPDTSPCMEFYIDRPIIQESFSRFSNLLIEPLKTAVRDIEFRLSSLKQAVVSADLISNITKQICEGQSESPCLSEATEMLSQRLNYYRQQKKNITLEMIKTQDLAEAANKDVHVLKEQIFAQISQSIKKYTCCLKSFNFTVKDNDCNPKPVEIPTTTMRTFRNILKAYPKCEEPNFLCDNHKCILDTYRCDGDDDCGDMSDEVNC